MALKSAVIWGAGQTAIRMALGLISIKITALFLGPEGLGLIGQLNNFISLIYGAIGTAIETGIIKFTAEYEDDKQSYSPLWSTAIKLGLMISGTISLILILACIPISTWLLGNSSYWYIIICTAIAIPFIVLGGTLTGILNGLKKINTIGLNAIISTFIGSMIFIPLSYFFRLNGAFIGTLLASTMVFVVVTISMVRAADIKKHFFSAPWNTPIAKSLLAFYPMLLVHAIAEPLAPLLVRNAIIHTLSLASSGIWQATLRLSDMYTMLITTALSMYLMPHLSSITDKSRFGRELLLTSIKVSVLTAVGALSLFLLRDFIVQIVFKKDSFYAVRDLLPLQLIGDVVKMAAWPLRMALVIKVRSYTYMAIEVGVTCIQVALTYALLPKMGITAATTSYALAWGTTLIVLLILFRDYWITDVHHKEQL